MIYDGKPPDVKRAALKQRAALRETSEVTLKVLEADLASVPMSEAQKTVVEEKLKTLSLNSSYFTSEERDLTKQFLYACGVLSLNATGEADDVLAYLARRGEFAAIISNDLDLLARGVETLLVPDNYALPGDPDGWISYSLTGILNAIGFDYCQFVEMCVLMGCDYTVGHKSLPYRSAYWAVKYRGAISKTLAVLGVPDHAPYLEATERLKGNCETIDTLMGEKQWIKWYGGAPPVEPETLALFRKGPLATLSELQAAAIGDRSDSSTDRPIGFHDHPKCAYS
jgi:flap endonuclease-1